MKIAIVGGGPTGIFTSLILSKQGHDIILFETNTVIGGCHRVDRSSNGRFSEHGPRIYLSNYKNFEKILSLCNISFKKNFKKYKYGFITSGISGIFGSLSSKEILSIILNYIIFMIKPSKFYNESVYDTFYNFSKESLKILDNMCKLTDGAGVERYTTYSFFNLLNQNILYDILQPKYANDKWLWGVVQKELVKYGNKIINEKVLSILENGEQVYGVKTKTSEYTVDAVILATPPFHTAPILNYSSPSVRDSFGINVDEYSKSSTYDTYVSFTIHFDENIKSPSVWGRPSDDWNVAWIVLSDYMKDESKLLISATIFDLDSISSYTKLTANNTSNKNDLLNEASRQVLKALNITEKPSDIILNNGVIRRNNKWETEDKPFMLTPNTIPVSWSSSISNFYWVGPHNMKNVYAFTSMENVCENVLEFCNYFENKKIIKKNSFIFTLNKLTFLIGFIVLIIVFKKFKKK